MRFMSLALLLAACGPEFAVVPHDGRPAISANAPTGSTLTAFANQWDGYPDDLADYVTPISVELYNPGPNEIRVLYCDFVLKDAGGHRYGAINPFTPSMLGRIDFELDKPVMLAGRGGGGGGHGGGGFHGGGGYHGGAPRAAFGYHGGFHTGGMSISMGPRLRWGVAPIYHGPGFIYYGGLRTWYGSGAMYWGGPWSVPLWYNDWVYYWGPQYYPYRPSADVLQLALPEGVIPPGGKVDGFLYFKRATAGSGGDLDLAWEMYDAKTNQALGTLHVPLVAVRSR
jgi:hypothetical protein